MYHVINLLSNGSRGKNLYCFCSFCKFEIVQNKIHCKMKLGVSFKDNSNGKERKKDYVTSDAIQWWQENIKYYESHVDHFPNKEIAVYSKLPTQETTR